MISESVLPKAVRYRGALHVADDNRRALGDRTARKPLRDGKDRVAGRSRTAPGDDGNELRADGLLEITIRITSTRPLGLPLARVAQAGERSEIEAGERIQ